jgi:hypothetical protein
VGRGGGVGGGGGGGGSKGGRCLGLTILSSCADCLEIWEPQHPETLRARPGLYTDCFTFTLRCF